MPRQARIDAPGALHHIIIRGIERKPIFKDDGDRKNFIQRLGDLVEETATHCYAWALMSNHVHLLLRTSDTPIASVMRRLLTGYAISFNRRHSRHGHLFQNRYKSILCESDAYLKQLVAYIHLNPFRVGNVEDIEALNTYPYTGHCALMGKRRIAWQETETVLAIFGKTVSDARKSYTRYLKKWSSKGRRPELTGGGLIRSAGGWRAVRSAFKDGIRLTSDERILGSSDFVEKTLADAGEAYERRMRLKSAGIDLDHAVNVVSSYLKIDKADLDTASRTRPVSKARAVISYLAVRELQIPGTEVSKRMNVDRSSISRSIARVKKDPELSRIVEALLPRLTPGKRK